MYAVYIDNQQNFVAFNTSIKQCIFIFSYLS